jgi:hypothetical protein
VNACSADDGTRFAARFLSKREAPKHRRRTLPQRDCLLILL